MSKRKPCLAVAGALFALILMGGAATLILLIDPGENRYEYPDPENETDEFSSTSEFPPSSSELPITSTSSPELPPTPPSSSVLGQYGSAAISCDAPECAKIASDILQREGTVVDAAIAALLCMGVIHSQSMGIGGGFVMVYYDRANQKSHSLIARETAPKNATEDMFEGDSDLSSKGGLAVAVPGEMKGYWEIYNKFGKGVPWSDLFQPTIKICEEGFEVDRHTAGALSDKRGDILEEPSLEEIFIDPKTHDVYGLGDIIKRPDLAETLKVIAADDVNGGNLLYQKDSPLAKMLIEDLEDLGSIITMEDLEEYQVSWREPLTVAVHDDINLHTIPPPGSGVLMAFVLRVLNSEKYQLTPNSVRNVDEAIETYHLIIEAFKHAYAKRTILGDPFDSDIVDEVNELVHNMTVSEEYLESILEKIKPDSTSNKYEDYGAEFYTPDDHGTSHISIIGPNGDAVAITSTVNLYFGAKIRSRQTGIIFNDEMDDFSAPNITNSFGVPPSPNNFIKPGKRPLSSMTPAIFTDKAGDVRLVVGGSGGTKITTAATYVALRSIWFEEDIKVAIDAKRIHHQLAPMEVECENGLPSQLVQGFEAIGHKTAVLREGASIMGVARSENGTLWANCDVRKPCSIDGF